MKRKWLMILLPAVLLISPVVLLGYMQASADDSADQGLVPPGLTLRPGVPHWANKASGTVWFSFTNRFQELKRMIREDAGKGIAETGEDPYATVYISQKVFNKEPWTAGLPQNEESIAIDPTNMVHLQINWYVQRHS